MLVLEVYKVRRCDACATPLSKASLLSTNDVSKVNKISLDHNSEEAIKEEYCQECSKKILDRIMYKGYDIDLAKSEVIAEGKYRQDLARQGIALL